MSITDPCWTCPNRKRPIGQDLNHIFHPNLRNDGQAKSITIDASNCIGCHFLLYHEWVEEFQSDGYKCQLFKKNLIMPTSIMDSIQKCQECKDKTAIKIEYKE